ncbi:bifunctional glycosyltransferase family 2/GtrA family protein [Cryobacterium sp. PH29-G1]|uniref:bifunctional glycosyltransferase family 2/GtrA family protein n=1 Tax=Cryobacterium sp. PH29-G1 TaxID=3046211 RepID=UPI0024B9A924|nr:bifunctional glycosyltransferase family 2/GtrA family protein [Cryobacterium sp. PH29-G1]MDJ0348862.1 bifunctional glycosyltransferase family 2/GtrA family protein [Cryobacterium sp. PH29-G1]
MIALIPAYEPGAHLLEVITGLRQHAPWLTVLVVDDGSGARFDAVFAAAERAGAEVIRYPTNRGKGHALKVGFRHIQRAYPGQDVVCADSDGQHSTTDIVRVAEWIRGSDGAIVLGGRHFTGAVPLRSKVGNLVARHAFESTTGFVIRDTQTGLRGYPAALLPWLLSIKGERFEYELNMLLDSSANHTRIDELDIETIYLEHNASSHFRPISDSLRVMLPLLLFATVSFASFLVDVVGLQLLFTATGSLLASVVGARLVSGSMNFLLNRRLVFRAQGSGHGRGDALRYIVLALALVAASYLFLAALTGLGIALLPAKLLTDTTLYVLSFLVQRRFVFARRDIRAPDSTTTATAVTPAPAAAAAVSAPTGTRSIDPRAAAD